MLEYSDDGSSDTATFYVRDGRLSIELDHPWAGDSQSGIGRNLQNSIGPDEVRELIAFLQKYFP